MRNSGGETKRRWWRVVLWIIATPALVYLIGVNLFLNTGLMCRVVNAQQPEKFQMGFDYAYTWWPGRAHVKNMRLRGQEVDVQYMLDIAEADTGIDIPSFFHQRFRTHWVKASGVTFRLRPQAGDAPPLPDYKMPPLGPNASLMLIPLNLLWNIELMNADVKDVREIAVAGYTYRGSAHAAGSFYLKPLQVVELAPSTLDFPPGGTFSGPDQKLVTNLHGKVVMAMEPFHPLEEKGVKPLRYITANVGLQGVLADLNGLFADGPVHVEGGEGPFSVDLDVVRGALTSKTKLDFPPRPVVIEAAGYHGEGDLTLSAEVPDEAHRTEGHVTIQVSPMLIRPIHQKDSLMRSDGLVAKLTLPHVQLERGAEDVSLIADLKPTTLARMGKLTSKFLPKSPVHPTSERGRIAGHLEISPGLAWAKGKFNLELPGIRTRYSGFDFSGDLALDADFADVPVRGPRSLRKSRLDFSLLLDDLEARAGEYAIEGKLHATGQRRSGEPEQLAIDISPVRVTRNGLEAPLVAGPGLRTIASWPKNMGLFTLSGLETASVTVELANATMPNMVVLNHYLPRGTDFHIASGRGEVRAYFHLHADGTPSDGTIDVSTQHADATYGTVKLKGDMRTRVVLSGVDIARQRVELKGTSISLSNVSVDGANATKSWEGEVEVDEGLLNAMPFSINGKVRGQFKDGRPILAVFATAANVPQWVMPMIHLENLKVAADVSATQKTVALSSFDVSGGSLKLKGNLRFADNVKNGAMLIGAGPLVFGLGLKNDKPTVQVADPGEWFQRESALTSGKNVAEHP